MFSETLCRSSSSPIPLIRRILRSWPKSLWSAATSPRYVTVTRQTAFLLALMDFYSQALQHIDHLDAWLAAHLTDLLDKVGIVEHLPE
jgi:hypothetical protein